jgi:hypothetical protein
LAAGWSVDRDSGTARLFAGTTRADLAAVATVLDRVLAALRTAHSDSAATDQTQ